MQTECCLAEWIILRLNTSPVPTRVHEFLQASVSAQALQSILHDAQTMCMHTVSYVGHLMYTNFNAVYAVFNAFCSETGMFSCSCPGVFSGQGCGAKLKWVQFREGKGCWGCCSWPACDYKEAATERLATPQVTLEAVSKELFKVVAWPTLLCVAYPMSKVP